MVDFDKLVKKNKHIDPNNLLALFESLDRKASHIDLRPAQRDALELLTDRRADRDIVLKMSTGSGKTVAGLVYLLSFMEEFKQVSGPLMKSAVQRKGASIGKRGSNIGKVLGLIRRSGKQLKDKVDPVLILEKKLKGEKEQLDKIKEEVIQEINIIVEESLTQLKGGDSK